MCAANGVSFEPLRLWLLSSQTPYSHPVMGIALWRMTKGMLTGRRLLCQRHQPLALAEVRTNWYIGMMWYVVIGGRISCVRHEAEIGLTAVLTFTINGLFFMLKNKISSSSWISGVIQYNATRSKNIMRYTIFRSHQRTALRRQVTMTMVSSLKRIRLLLFHKTFMQVTFQFILYFFQ